MVSVMHRFLSIFSSVPTLQIALLLLLVSCDAADSSDPSIDSPINRSMEFSLSCRKNETGHFITDFSLKKSSPQLPNNWKLNVKHSVTEYGGIQAFQLLGVIVANPPVPADYRLYPGIGYYKFHNTKVTFDEASRMCAAEGGHLAIINSDAESGVITALFQATPNSGAWAWLGFHDRLVEGEFVTIFGQPLKSSGFYKWYSPKEPNGGTRENCGSVAPNGLLNDENCGSKIPFICEFDLSWTDI